MRTIADLLGNIVKITRNVRSKKRNISSRPDVFTSSLHKTNLNYNHHTQIVQNWRRSANHLKHACNVPDPVTIPARIYVFTVHSTRNAIQII